MSDNNGQLRRTRVYSRGTEGDNRSQFERDRDRILYTPAFRRLAGVTQVVHVNTERGYHNRLTHSLKVAQVGKRLAEHLINKTDDSKISDAGGLNENVVETACLAHDIGHPPFGHAAEEALQNQLDGECEHIDRSIIDSFEGNPQSFRVVNNVAINKTPYGEKHEGLDLTLASLNAILKYPWSRDTSGKKSKKWGYYNTEKNEAEQAKDLRRPGNIDEGLSVEAKTMDWADDVTYAIHDMTDFYMAGLIPLDKLFRNAEEREELAEEFEDDDASNDIPSTWDATGFIDENLRDLTNVAGNGNNPLTSPFEGTSDNRTALSFATSELIERYLGLDNNVDIEINPTIEGGLDIDNKLEYEIELLQFLSKYYVFSDSALVAQQRGHKELVEKIFNILYEATKSDSEYSDILPRPFDEKILAIHEGNYSYEDVDSKTLRARIVADIIANMTEQQAMDLFKRVTGHAPGLVTDRIVT